MPRQLRSLLLSALVVAVVGPAARAQYVGVGVARPYGIYGAYSPSYLGIYPGAYQGFWSNGFSLYGPPVPTYGSVPGFFGGADQRLSNFPNIYMYNGASIGLGQPGAGGAGPRRRHWTEGGGGVLPGALPTGQALIDVRLPTPDAEVFFEGTDTQQKGARRVFQSPTVEAGTTYFYKVRARWKQPDGSIADQERSIGVRANATTIVDFNEPAATPEHKPAAAIE